MATRKIWLVWDIGSFIWNKVPLTWNEAFLLEEIADHYGGGGPGFYLEDDDTWKKLDSRLKKDGYDEEKRKRLLKIIVKLNGLTREEEREIDEETKKQITVDHIKKVFESVLREVKVTVIK